MALGKKIAEWDYRDIIRGISTSDDLPDGGFSPRTNAINLIATPGIAYQSAQATDKSTNVVGTIIASCEDPVLTGSDRVYLDNEGNFYTWNGTTMTVARTDGGHTYTTAKSDMAAFDGSVFATSDNAIAKWTVDSSFNAAFFALSGTYPHPLLVFENKLFIGNGNVLYRINDASDSTPDSILTLSANEVIMTLGIDPGSGRMLISTTQGLNMSLLRSNTNKVLYYDGFSNKVLKSVPVDATVTAFPFTEGQLYAAYGNTLGLWNGAGITFLRKFDITSLSTNLLYKQHFTSQGSTLYFIEESKIIAHGPIRQGGEKVFYPAFNNSVGGVDTDLTHIAYTGNGVLGLCFETDKFYTWNPTSVATTNTQRLFSNEYDFDDEMWIRRARVIYKDTVSSNVDPGSIRLLDENGVISNIGQNGLFDLRNTSGGSSAYKDILNINVKVKQFQFELILDTVNPGIRRIIFYGELANQP